MSDQNSTEQTTIRPGPGTEKDGEDDIKSWKTGSKIGVVIGAVTVVFVLTVVGNALVYWLVKRR